MFRITFFVEDKLLGEAFKRLAGVARNVEHAYVPNVDLAQPAAKTNGAGRITTTTVVEMLAAQLRKHKVEEFQGPFMRTILAELGMPPSVHQHRLAQMVKAGLLKKGKLKAPEDGGNRTMTYHVVK
jgi:hypothetical protein